jgi:hypothetical protein
MKYRQADRRRGKKKKKNGSEKKERNGERLKNKRKSQNDGSTVDGGKKQAGPMRPGRA